MVTPVLFARYRSAADYAAADREEFEKLIVTTGFFRNKTSSIIALGQDLCERFDGEVPRRLKDMVTLPGVEGQMGILPRHVPLMTHMVAGELIVRKNGQDRFLVVGEGFVEITGEHVAILTDLAVAAENIDEAKAEEARQLAAARLRETMSSEEIASVNAALARSLAQLRIKRRQRN